MRAVKVGGIMGIVDKAKEALGLSDADVTAAKDKAQQVAGKMQEKIDSIDQSDIDAAKDKAQQMTDKMQEKVDNLDPATKDKIASKASEFQNKAQDAINRATGQ